MLGSRGHSQVAAATCPAVCRVGDLQKCGGVLESCQAWHTRRLHLRDIVEYVYYNGRLWCNALKIGVPETTRTANPIVHLMQSCCFAEADKCHHLVVELDVPIYQILNCVVAKAVPPSWP